MTNANHEIVLATLHVVDDPTGRNRSTQDRLADLAKSVLLSHGLILLAACDGRQVDIVPKRSAKGLPGQSKN